MKPWLCWPVVLVVFGGIGCHSLLRLGSGGPAAEAGVGDGPRSADVRDSRAADRLLAIDRALDLPRLDRGLAEVLTDLPRTDGPLPKDQQAPDQRPPDLTVLSPDSGAGALVWPAVWGANGYDSLFGIAVDGQGNVTLAGSFEATVDFGKGAMTSVGSTDAYVASFSAAGQPRWSRRFGGSGADDAFAIAVDAAGDLYVTGQFEGSADFGAGAVSSNAGSVDIFVASYSALGAYRWAKVFGGDGLDQSWGVAVDGSGSIYVTGAFAQTINFGGGPLTSTAYRDIFIASLTTSTGGYRWARGHGGGLSDYGTGVAVDKVGNVYCTGQFYSQSFSLGGQTIVNASGSGAKTDGFVASYQASNGAHRWSARFGDTSDDQGQSVAADAGGNVYFTGVFSGTVSFGNGPPITAKFTETFLVGLDSSGSYRWAKQYTGGCATATTGIAIDAAGDVYLASSFDGTINFGATSISSIGGWDGLAARYSSSGALRWSKQFGGTNSEWVNAAAVAAGGHYIGGTFWQTTNLGRGPIVLPSGGQFEIFLVKLAP